MEEVFRLGWFNSLKDEAGKTHIARRIRRIEMAKEKITRWDVLDYLDNEKSIAVYHPD